MGKRLLIIYFAINAVNFVFICLNIRFFLSIIRQIRRFLVFFSVFMAFFVLNI